MVARAIYATQEYLWRCLMKQIIRTNLAPKAIGTYSQGVKAGSTVYISGQIPLDVETMEIVSQDITKQIEQTFKNLAEVAKASGGNLSDIVKLNVYLVDLDHFTKVNDIMKQLFDEPYPARAVLGVAALPKQSKVEIDAVMVLFD